MSRNTSMAACLLGGLLASGATAENPLTYPDTRRVDHVFGSSRTRGAASRASRV